MMMNEQPPSRAQLDHETEAILARWERARASLADSEIASARAMAERLGRAIDRERAASVPLAARHYWVFRNALKEAAKGPGKQTEPLPPLSQK